MYYPFDEMPNEARIWIYQSKTFLEPSSLELLKNKLLDFTEHWESHNRPLKASFELIEDRFLVIAVDESLAPASGCSVDSSVHFLKSLENELGLQLMDRSEVAYLLGEEIQTAMLSQIKSKVQDGLIQPDTLVFDNSLSKLSSFRNEWKKEANKTWLSRYF